MLTNYAKAFGLSYAIPAEITELISSGALSQDAYTSDSCPRFSTAVNSSITLVVWVENMAPASHRLCVSVENETETLLDLYDGDSAAAAAQMVRSVLNAN